MVFVTHSINVVYHVYIFAYVEPSLHPRNESHLITAYDPFIVLLNSVYWNFVEKFCTCIHWPVILFSLVSYSGFGIKVILVS